MDEDEELYDEFGNYIGPEVGEDEDEDDSDDDALENAYGARLVPLSWQAGG